MTVQAGSQVPGGQDAAGVQAWQRGTPARGTTAKSMAALLRMQALSGDGSFAAALAGARGLGRPATARSAAPSGAPVQVPNQYSALVNDAARRNGIDPALLAGVIETESGFNAQAGSPAGAKGLMQLMDSTARGLGVTNSYDPTQNVNGGAKFLRQLLDKYNGDTRLALAAYNAGPGAVDQYGGVPPYAETQRYVPTVLAAAERFRQNRAGMAPFE
ncbi:MAG TPA: lytic transglycosylase domain-containing protein [Chloroflexota bacterium]